jgi:hypothetical protein
VFTLFIVLRRSHFIVRYVPSWVPGVQFKKLAEEWSQLSAQLFDRPFEYVKEQMVHISECAYTSLTPQ